MYGMYKSFMGAFPAGFDEHLADALGQAEQALGQKPFAAMVERGADLSDEDVIAYTMSEITRLISD